MRTSAQNLLLRCNHIRNTRPSGRRALPSPCSLLAPVGTGRNNALNLRCGSCRSAGQHAAHTPGITGAHVQSAAPHSTGPSTNTGHVFSRHPVCKGYAAKLLRTHHELRAIHEQLAALQRPLAAVSRSDCADAMHLVPCSPLTQNAHTSRTRVTRKPPTCMVIRRKQHNTVETSG